jgi:hypothetical protein
MTRVATAITLFSTLLVAGPLGAQQSPSWSAAQGGQASPQQGKRVTPKPPPVHVDYLTYGAAITGDAMLSSGSVCSKGIPCILGSGGGLVLRGGYRSAGPWYIGGAYQVSKTDSSNIYRFATMQQLRAEMRYVKELGYRAAPYGTWGVGGMLYGNEWGAETGGVSAFAGLGVEVQLSRIATLGFSVQYQPTFVAGFVDTAAFDRSPGLAQFLRFELLIEIRSELSRR